MYQENIGIYYSHIYDYWEVVNINQKLVILDTGPFYYQCIDIHLQRGLVNYT